MFQLHRHTLISMAKLLLAAILLLGLMCVAAQDLAPQISFVKIFAYVVLGAVALAVNLVGLSVIYLNVYQWVLRKGGTDTSWFWFGREPKGLVALTKK